MAASVDSSRKARLAWVVDDVLAFSDDQIPNELLEHWKEFCETVTEVSVPTYALNHPYYPKSTKTYYITAKKTSRATELLMTMFEAIVYNLC